jgi:hypothetical protein
MPAAVVKPEQLPVVFQYIQVFMDLLVRRKDTLYRRLPFSIAGITDGMFETDI